MVERKLIAKLALRVSASSQMTMEEADARQLVRERLASCRIMTQEELEKETDAIFAMTLKGSGEIDALMAHSRGELLSLIEKSLEERKDISRDEVLRSLAKTLLDRYSKYLEDNRLVDCGLPSFSADELKAIEKKLDVFQPQDIAREELEALVDQLSCTNELFRAIDLNQDVMKSIPGETVAVHGQAYSLRRLLAVAAVMNLRKRGKLIGYDNVDDQTLCTLVCAREQAGLICDQAAESDWNDSIVMEMLGTLAVGIVAISGGAVLIGFKTAFDIAAGGFFVLAGVICLIKSIDDALTMAYPAGVISETLDRIKNKAIARRGEKIARQAIKEEAEQETVKEENAELDDEGRERYSMNMNPTNSKATLIDHPLFSNTKLQMVVAEFTAQAMEHMEKQRAEQPDISPAQLLTDTIAYALSRDRKLMMTKKLEDEVDYVVNLTDKTLNRLCETEENGCDQLAHQLYACSQEELEQLLKAQYQLYLHNVEKAKAADSKTVGAARLENPEKILNAVSEKTRSNASAIQTAIVSGAGISLDKEEMKKMAVEYTMVNNMYAMIYLALDAGVVKPDGSVVSLEECAPQETVCIFPIDESYERMAVMNAVLMNLRKNEYALNDPQDITAPDMSIPKDISDEDLCFWFACKDRLVGGCCRFAAGDAGMLKYVLNILGGVTAVMVVVVGIGLLFDALGATAVVNGLCAGLTKMGILSWLESEVVRASVMQFITGLGIKDNVIGLVLMLTGGTALMKINDKLDDEFPLEYGKTRQANRIRDRIVKCKAVDANDNLKRMYAAVDRVAKNPAATENRSKEAEHEAAQEKQSEKKKRLLKKARHYAHV